MPNVSTFLSGGVSVGILAGVVSGLFYLVVAGIRWAGEVKLQSGEWFYKQVQRRFYPAAIEHSNHKCNNGVGMDSECVQVREFIERLVESLVSGGLDDVCVKRLHSHPAYKPMPEQESPASAHSALKQLIQKIICEAMTLPTLQGLNQDVGLENGVPSEDMTSKTYEDILATAILNKVIQQYQKSGALDGNRNLLASSMEQNPPTYISRIEIGVKNPESLEDETFNNGSLNFDSSLNRSSVDPMSLTIEECIEVTTFNNAEEEDVQPNSLEDGKFTFSFPGFDFVQRHRVPFPELGMDIVEGSPLGDLSDHEDHIAEEDGEDEDRSSPLPTDLVNPVESWEENWLFQRRRLKNGGVPQPMPVPMLVPNPSEDYRALIGDRDAEEISDLSDCSDGALEDLVLAEEEEDNQFVQVHESADQTSGIQITLQESEPIETTDDYEPSDDTQELLEAKNVQLCKSSSVDCLSEFGQQDSEYTEDYAAATRRQLDSLSGTSDQEASSTPAPEDSLQQLDSEDSLQAEPTLKPSDDKPVQVLTDVGLAVPPRPGTEQSDDEYCTLPSTGTIAEREHKKWETAPPLPNNPYSPENISKRLSKKNQFNSRSSSSEASVEFPEIKNEPVVAAVIQKPLQIVCAPSDLDYKRYGRDYYINSKSSSNNKSQTPTTSVSTPQNSLQSPASQETPKPSCEIVRDVERNLGIGRAKEEPNINNEGNSKLEQGNTAIDSDVTDAPEDEQTREEHVKLQTSHLVESEVARLQKEINRNEQWYKHMIAKNDSSKTAAESNKVNNSSSSKDLHKFSKIIISDESNEKETLPVQKPRDFSKRQQIPDDDPKQETVFGKSSFKQIKFPTYQEHQKSPEIQIETRNGDIKHNDRKSIIDESYIEACFNGSGRSESPSEGSIISTDSEFNNLPSVKELTKRFSTMADSDSSTTASTPKSPSPAPRWKTPEQPPIPAERTVLITERPSMQSSLSPSRPVREVHSLTARSISREFREGLRRNQPLQLDRNIYNQSGSCTSLTASSNGESSSIPSSASSDQDTTSPIPQIIPRSVSSNIAFWEQLHQDKP